MPIFEFTCKSCKKNFEELVLKADESITCPDCSSQDIEKLISSCRHSSIGNNFSSSQKLSSGSGCSGCSGGNCSSCG